MAEPHQHEGSAVSRDQLQQLQYSHFHHPFPSSHHPYAQLQQQQDRHAPGPAFSPDAPGNQLPYPASAHHHHPQQHQHQQQQQQTGPAGLGFLPPDDGPHVAVDAAHPPGHAPTSGFPPPAQPTFFSSGSHQAPQFHHPGHPHLYQHQHQHSHPHAPLPMHHGHHDPATAAAAAAGPPVSPISAGIPPPDGGAPPPGLAADPRTAGLTGPPHPQAMGHAPLPVAAKAGSLRRAKKSMEGAHPGISQADPALLLSPLDAGPMPAGAVVTPVPGSASAAAFYSTPSRPALGSTPATSQGGLPALPPADASTSASAASLHMHNANVPTRKQNQSCDNCRRRKIACRPPAPHLANPHRRCAHCLNKGVDCTHEYVSRVQGAKQLAAAETSKKPRKSGPAGGAGTGAGPDHGRSLALSGRMPSYGATPAGVPAAGHSGSEDEDMGGDEDGDDLSQHPSTERSRHVRSFRDAVSPSASSGSGGGAATERAGQKRSRVDSGVSSGTAAYHRQPKAARPGSYGPGHGGATGRGPTHVAHAGPGPAGTRLHPTAQLIRYLLSPSDAASPLSLDADITSSSSTALSSYFPNPLRLPIPTPAARRLAHDAKLRSEVLHDFVESFLMIVNPRFALLDARRVRAGIYPFEELVLEPGTSAAAAADGDRHTKKRSKQSKGAGQPSRRRAGGRRWRNAEEYLYRSDSDGEQDDGGLPSCAPASRQQRDQHLAAGAPQPVLPSANGDANGTGPDAPGRSAPVGATTADTGSSTRAGAPRTHDLGSLRPRPLPDVLIAVVLAFGAKFSSHEILGEDRAQSARYLRKAWDVCKRDAAERAERRLARRRRQMQMGMNGGLSADDSSDDDDDDDDDEEEEEGASASDYAFEPSIICSGRSTIAKSLLIKAQDVLEKRRAFALPTLTNVQAALLMEPIFDQGVRLDEHKRGTPKWEMLAELLLQLDGEEDLVARAEHGSVDGYGDESGAPHRRRSSSRRSTRTDSIVSSRELDAPTTRRLLRTATALSARTRGSDNTGAQPSLDFCGFWHSVALRHLLELRLHEADYVATLADIDILTARRLDFFGEAELERKVLAEQLKAGVEAERKRLDEDVMVEDDGTEAEAEAQGGAGRAVARRRMPAHTINALDAAIGATNSLGTLAQSAWWLASTSDAITSAFFRKRPLMRPEEMLGGGHIASDDESGDEDVAAAAGAPEAVAEALGVDMEVDAADSASANKDGVASAKASRPGSSHTHSSAGLAGHGKALSIGQGSVSVSVKSPLSGSTGGATAGKRGARKLVTGGITREAGPDPYEGSDDEEGRRGQAGAEQQVQQQRTLDKSASATSLRSEADAGASSGPNATATPEPLSAGTAVSGSTESTNKRATAKREKLALLGERVSLPKKDSYAIWYSGISELCKIHRLMWDTLWSPRARAQGVQLRPLRDIQRRTEKWRKTYLPKMGVPYDADGSQPKQASWPKEWDFIAASTANTLSINSFALDILMWQAVEDHGIAEALEADGEGDAVEEGAGTKVDAAKAAAAILSVSQSRRPSEVGVGSGGGGGGGRRATIPCDVSSETLSPAARAERSVCNNALAASLRIAALVEVLRANYYLRLDPNILHFTIHAAGQFLVTYDNPAVYSIIEGLKQYGLSYEEGLEQADQLAAYAHAARIPHQSPAAAARDASIVALGSAPDSSVGANSGDGSAAVVVPTIGAGPGSAGQPADATGRRSGAAAESRACEPKSVNGEAGGQGPGPSPTRAPLALDAVAASPGVARDAGPATGTGTGTRTAVNGSSSSTVGAAAAPNGLVEQSWWSASAVASKPAPRLVGTAPQA